MRLSKCSLSKSGKFLRMNVNERFLNECQELFKAYFYNQIISSPELTKKLYNSMKRRFLDKEGDKSHDL